jgi:hypothetical protein
MTSSSQGSAAPLAFEDHFASEYAPKKSFRVTAQRFIQILEICTNSMLYFRLVLQSAILWIFVQNGLMHQSPDSRPHCARTGTSMTDGLEAAFDTAMRDIYHSALSECNYKAIRFRLLVAKHGGVSAAKQLLRARNHSEGLTKLWERGCLHLSMEQLVLRNRWRQLLTDDEREIARRRLRELNYSFSED